MRFPQQYPLVEDIGFPHGLRAARERWVAATRRERMKSRASSVIAAVSMIGVLAFFGMVPWMIQRVASRESLDQHMARNMPHGNAHLGAEYYNIAAAIVDGRGFSDPFVVRSGPTAWMPPLLVWLQAGLISLFDGDRYWVMVAVVTMKTLLLCLCASFVVRQGWRSNDGWVAFGVLTAFVVSEFHACFSFTHDGWLILAGVMATVCGLAKMDQAVRSGQFNSGLAVAWGLLGGLVALSSPVAGFTWAVATTLCLLLRAPKGLLLAAVTSMVVITPWTIRNKHVLGKYIPVKSNAFFEFDQSLALDEDGLLDYETMGKHPYHAGPEQDTYIKMGEIAYLETKQDRFLSQVKSNPEVFYQKMKNRLIGTTLWPAGFSAFHNPLRWLLYPWPALAVIFLLLFARPLTPLQRWTIVVYVVYLIPYIICSYYPRYGFPLFFIKILLCYWVIERAITLLRRTQARLA